LNDEIINKPVSKEDAFVILKKLSGNSHFVYTGVTVLNSATSKAITDYSLTRVYFRELSDSEILDYISTGSPMDKAGAYGIQDDYGALFVKRIEGCYNNVIGLPLELMFRILLEAIN
jgi:septum formation protein